VSLNAFSETLNVSPNQTNDQPWTVGLEPRYRDVYTRCPFGQFIPFPDSGRDPTTLAIANCVPGTEVANRKVLSPLVGESQREGWLALCANCFSPSPQPSPLKREGVIAPSPIAGPWVMQGERVFLQISNQARPHPNPLPEPGEGVRGSIAQ